jgi:hypothetical protein
MSQKMEVSLENGNILEKLESARKTSSEQSV